MTVSDDSMMHTEAKPIIWRHGMDTLTDIYSVNSKRAGVVCNG